MKTYNVSESKFAESKKYLSGGVSSSLRASMKPVPIFAESASGTQIRDVDGNEYIDYMLAYGPLILGHSHPVLMQRIVESMQVGFTYGIQHEGEIELARLLTEVLPAAEQVAFSGSGTEAVMLALRLAKAYTGKRKVVRFHGHYHGWSDSIFTSFPSSDMSQKPLFEHESDVPPGTAGQSEGSLQDVLLLPWNEPELLEQVLRTHHQDIAAVITEPIMCNSGCIMPLPGYLENMRKWTKALGIVLIFDEVITGFRLSNGGAHGKFGIIPDLVTVGKALGGGIAISAVGGSRSIMELVESAKVSHLGTLNGNRVSTTAAITTIRELSKNNGHLYQQMEATAGKLAEGIRSLFRKHDIPGLVNQPGPMFHVMFTELTEVNHFDHFQKRDADAYTRFAELLMEEGVLVRPNGLWYVSAVHSDREVDETLKAIDRVLEQLPNHERKI
ncbi:aspartate aminotransferase family protein [Paenibacillus agricola]|uniref:Aspartate aminotransferase family protein n=1 Tax=Paenibacillus agricola TaxID=2716264 RepID=A0ABX0J8R6_9BACL|nr:aspartate aminotransferase family protein [Paenibacillus agricola]NHN32759.1 aspartate aminotransferase family protein [Paenibacillus agricola]